MAFESLRNLVGSRGHFKSINSEQERGGDQNPLITTNRSSNECGKRNSNFSSLNEQVDDVDASLN